MSLTQIPRLAYISGTVRYEDRKVVLLNRKLYPERVEHVSCSDYKQVGRAIKEMTIQGAIIIAMAAGYGFVQALEQSTYEKEQLLDYAERVTNYLNRQRPTGQRMKVILDKCIDSVRKGVDKGDTREKIAYQVRKLVDREVSTADQVAVQCGKNAAHLLEDGDRVLTHCFADSALIHMLLEVQKQGKTIEMYCTETRPYFQGARLTAHSIKETGTKVTLVTDNMPGFLMQQGMVNKLVTAADKITLDGHVCNKVGTYQYAVLAQHHNIPYYVLGYEGPDMNSPSAQQIEIEYRDAEEVFYARGVRTAIEGIEGFYPSFDIVTPNFVDAIVTDKGIFAARNIADYLQV